MKNVIYIIVDYRGLYRQDISRSRGINLETVKNVFVEAGYQVIVKSFSELANEDIAAIEDSYIFYTSSESLEYKEYIKGIIYELGKRNVLIPEFDILMCHEDKCYQELYKKRKHIESLKSYCYGSVRELDQDVEKFEYPIVIKKYSGAGSISVYKADNKEQLLKLAKKINRNREFYEYHLKRIYKKMKGKLDSEYSYDDAYLGRIVVQQFVPDLENDWKVLVFGEKIYCLYRGVRKKDFRASGSGQFQFVNPPEEILDMARNIYEKMQVPFLSLDLCEDKNKNVYLIEFQGLHFGPYTLIKSEKYFTKQEGKWTEHIEKSDLAKEYAIATLQYINKMEGK